ncbi:MAG: MarR family transcriptional regulator [Candidatus Micrarchaeota archaeon]
MLFGLRRNEILAFCELCRAGGGQVTIGGLAESLGWSKSVASRAANGLAGKGLAQLRRDGQRKLLAVSKSANAVAALKELLAAYPHIAFQDLLAGSSMRVLCGLLFAPASVAAVAMRGRLPQITVRRVLAKLLERGLVGRRRPGEYSIALPGLSGFVLAYCAFAVDAARGAVFGSLIVRGANGLLRTSSPAVPKSMVLTGVSVFGKYGIGIVATDYRDYYFNAFGKPGKPGVEEAVVHALLRSTVMASGREVSYALLVLCKNRKRIDGGRLLECARDFGVESDARQALEFVDCVLSGRPVRKPLVDFGNRVEGPLFPGEEEFKELVRQYG